MGAYTQESALRSIWVPIFIGRLYLLGAYYCDFTVTDFVFG